MLVYEYPFNETVRSILRLEYLFQRLEVFLQSDNPEHHLTAISLMFDIGDVTSRADLKSSLLKELERQRALLASFRTEASVNSAALELTINDLEDCLSKLNQLVGRPNTLINESEWLGNYPVSAECSGRNKSSGCAELLLLATTASITTS